MTVWCKACGKTFASISNLNKHLKTSCKPCPVTQNQVTQPKFKLKVISPIKHLSLSEKMAKLETDIVKLSKDMTSSQKEMELLKNRIQELTQENQYFKTNYIKLKYVLTDEFEDECLPISGNKSELIDRLSENEQASISDETKLVLDLYRGMTIAKLKKSLKDKGLPISGKKYQLIDRLVAQERVHTTITSTFDSDQNQIETIRGQGKVEKSAVAPTCKIDKLKRQTIPKAIKIEVWNLYIGHNKNKAICPLCLIREINTHNTDWHCSHVISDVHGGKPTLSNLRALCGTCNQSMGRMDMCEYILTSVDDGWEAISRLQLSLQCDNWIKGDPMNRNKYRP
jgi:regulator of replication initiation timing